MVSCNVKGKCFDRDTDKCISCENNTMRNYVESYFVAASDKDVDTEYKPHFDGPIEQTSGYKCLVCGKFSNPYTIKNMVCEHCGYRMGTVYHVRDRNRIY